MQFSSIIAVLASASAILAFPFIHLKARQDLSGLPDCAVTCFEDNFANTTCALTDTACLCADTVFYGDVETCVIAACDTDDLLTTLVWSESECPSS